ncbi:hypothetical protein Hanom_Chr06g00569841 [Helianthus anomalus]
MELDAPQTIDIGFLTDIGSIGRVQEFMPATSPWARLFEAGRERAHREITLEFLCTFAFTKSRGRGLRYILKTPAVSFTLCGASRSMTLPQFVVAMGLYSHDESISHAFLDTPTTTSVDVLWPWWRNIGAGEFVQPHAQSPKVRLSSMYDPLHRTYIGVSL